MSLFWIESANILHSKFYNRESKIVTSWLARSDAEKYAKWKTGPNLKFDRAAGWIFLDAACENVYVFFSSNLPLFYFFMRNDLKKPKNTFADLFLQHRDYILD